MKVVINKCYGGFGLSRKALEKIYELKGIKIYAYQHSFQSGTWTKLPDGKEVFCTHYVNIDLGDTYIGKVANINQVSEYNIERNDPELIKVVEEMGEAANGSCADLRIVEIPDDVEWEIEEYDGTEWISEKHSTWS